MSTPLRLVSFAALLVALFGVGNAMGRILEPGAPGGEQDEARHAIEGDAKAAHGDSMTMPADDVELAPGTARAAEGYSLELADRVVEPGVTRPLRFRIVGSDGESVTEFDLEHERRMHVIVARDDLTGFQHLHPRMSEDGEWSVPLRLGAPGSYRVFADFSADETPLTLSDSLLATGEPAAKPLPAPATAATSEGGYDVELAAGDLEAGGEAELRFTVTRDGEPVAIEPYLGAGGHLVALREGDLAYLHVHPLGGASGSGSGGPTGEPIAFSVQFPTAAAYRLFLQFKVDGRLETAEFTQEVR